MKKILNILWSITLIGTSTTSLVACNTPQYSEEKLKEQKEKHKIDTKNQTIRDNLEWIAPQEKPFNEIDNKYYYVLWKGQKWNIKKFKNNEKIQNKYSFKILEQKYEYKLKLHRYSLNYEVDLNVYEPSNMTNWPWRIDHGTYFKSVYRWNSLDKPEPDLVLDDKDNIKVKD
ncbi:lipoprotein [Spiroplasma endosymbiont of Polydrusus pterygomalis]|uniref:lipoprotein n=1 Tax=Spiroplasma endosymbiont of Polydrusus pterygomalis TaxID=3139327 RepID=UPI003CCB166C